MDCYQGTIGVRCNVDKDGAGVFDDLFDAWVLVDGAGTSLAEMGDEKVLDPCDETLRVDGAMGGVLVVRSPLALDKFGCARYEAANIGHSDESESHFGCVEELIQRIVLATMSPPSPSSVLLAAPARLIDDTKSDG